MRRKAFIDSSILYTAAISRIGHAHDLIRLAIAGTAVKASCDSW